MFLAFRSNLQPVLREIAFGFTPAYAAVNPAERAVVIRNPGGDLDHPARLVPAGGVWGGVGGREFGHLPEGFNSLRPGGV